MANQFSDPGQEPKGSTFTTGPDGTVYFANGDVFTGDQWSQYYNSTTPEQRQSNGFTASLDPSNPQSAQQQQAQEASGSSTATGFTSASDPNAIANNAPGAQLDTTDADAQRTQMGQLVSQLQQQAATGNGGWAQSFQNAVQQAQGNASALGQSQNLQAQTGGADARRNVLNSQAGIQQGSVAQGQQLQTQSENNAQDELGQLLSTQGEGDIAQDQATAAVLQAQREANASLNEQGNKNVQSDISAGGQGVATIAAAASRGGRVPGRPRVFGDDERNDTVPAMLSPEETVVPRSLSKNPTTAAAFAAAIAMKMKPDKAKVFARAVMAHRGVKKLADGGYTGWQPGDTDPTYSLSVAPFSTPSESASLQNGAVLDTSNYQQTRGQMDQLAGQYGGRAGGANSTADAQQTQANNAAMMSALQAASARRPVAANVLQGAASQGDRNAAATGAQRLSDQARGQQALGNLETQRRAQELELASDQQKAGWNNTMLNEGISLSNQALLQGQIAAGGQGIAALTAAASRGSGSNGLGPSDPSQSNPTTQTAGDAAFDQSPSGDYPEPSGDTSYAAHGGMIGALSAMARGGSVSAREKFLGAMRRAKGGSVAVVLPPPQQPHELMLVLGGKGPKKMADGGEADPLEGLRAIFANPTGAAKKQLAANKQRQKEDDAADAAPGGTDWAPYPGDSTDHAMGQLAAIFANPRGAAQSQMQARAADPESEWAAYPGVAAMSAGGRTAITGGGGRAYADGGPVSARERFIAATKPLSARERFLSAVRAQKMADGGDVMVEQPPAMPPARELRAVKPAHVDVDHRAMAQLELNRAHSEDYAKSGRRPSDEDDELDTFAVQRARGGTVPGYADGGDVDPSQLVSVDPAVAENAALLAKENAFRRLGEAEAVGDQTADAQKAAALAALRGQQPVLQLPGGQAPQGPLETAAAVASDPLGTLRRGITNAITVPGDASTLKPGVVDAAQDAAHAVLPRYVAPAAATVDAAAADVAARKAREEAGVQPGFGGAAAPKAAAAPAAPAPVRTSGMPAPADKPVDTTAFADEQAAIRQQGDVEAQKAAQTAKVQLAYGDTLQAHALEQKAMQDRARQQGQEMIAAQRRLAEQVNSISTTVDPDRFWASRSTPQKIMGIVGLALGAVGSRDGTNKAADLLNRAIERDIDAQKVETDARLRKGQASLAASNQIYAMNRQLFGDDMAAMDATKATAWDVVKNQVDRIGSQYAGPEAQAQKAALAAHAGQMADQYRLSAADKASEAKLRQAQSANLYAEAEKNRAAAAAKGTSDVGADIAASDASIDDLAKEIQQHPYRDNIPGALPGSRAGDFDEKARATIETIGKRTGMSSRQIEKVKDMTDALKDPKLSDAHRAERVQVIKDFVRRTVGKKAQPEPAGDAT